MWILMEPCGECAEPTKQFDICRALGYNPGLSGHLFDTKEEAEKAMALYDARTEGRKCAELGVKAYEMKL